jgi:hypothetical protein
VVKDPCGKGGVWTYYAADTSHRTIWSDGGGSGPGLNYSDHSVRVSDNEEGSWSERTTSQEDHSQTGRGAADGSGSEESKDPVAIQQ